MTTVQQIRYTDHPERWHALAGALGLTPPYRPTPEWAEFEGDGVLAIHRATPDRPAGAVDLHVLAADLDAAAEAVAAFDTAREEMADVGAVLRIAAVDGVAVTVSAGVRAPRGDLAMQPIWFAHDLDEPRRLLEALGLRAQIVGDRGGWVDLAAPGGGAVGLHAVATADMADAPSIGLSFLAAGDLDALARRVRAAGFDAAVIDESYGRTIRIPDPDGGEEIWINGVQDDLYGYDRET
ncbi:hypothetical protein [Microbacterium marinilacus]|uniref:VOC family protein n=1 Tax=Microbacterium marinilacus TaxID=415209 RepID=A0ABP7B260_9MICO|nr:hypothetical protein [Microbacterium marinilacus]MBY0688552.1 hypothetical protein [Microbacterium marinilacus]